MRLGTLHVCFDAGDLRLQGLDPCLQLLDRHRVEVLPRKRDQRIFGLAWEEFFEVHG